MNRKAQALVEFVLILPILIMLIFAFLDIGRIYTKKSELESLSTSVISYMRENSDTTDNDINSYLASITDTKIKFKRVVSDLYTTIRLSSDTLLITPGINLILGNDYKVKVERVIPNE